MNDTVSLAKALLARPSVTPDDAGCLDLIGDRLAALGFDNEIMQFGEVTNLWATRGDGGPIFAFAGHTDVVPPGPQDQWRSDPFKPTLIDEHLFGRGTADMKSSLAAMVTALERLSALGQPQRGTIALLLTSDEEGIATHGTKMVMETLLERGIKIDWCLVGEPSSSKILGDQIRNGRRGSLNGVLKINGVQGHVAYPDDAENPIHAFAAALTDLCSEKWDRGNKFYPPTSFQISNINAGTGAENVIPGELEIVFNFRFGTESTVESLQHRVVEILTAHDLDYDLSWRVSGLPFLTAEGPLLDAVTGAISETLDISPAISTGGGTSDGRFIAPAGAEVVEFGPVNATIHKINECIRVTDIDALSNAYEDIVRRLMY
ncbi:MAG: succinyl-diaminopimelate desuccinylase [Gammaproteobacteria bacterium]